ncbi:hypothetical protein PHLCEN_2v5127 [Hermanssonia centrifuga]|uniref:Fungal-type protein kinase domain-containing protein n=1 Tax=Hermanssonia centrifuga TaxID=98765 RepID=A0A2R6PBU7_9APHY|nr:hypothetical protein PHLCEN_2v5127 [Hermanssonia centrifuga]
MATSSSPSLQSGSILKTPHGEATEVTIQFFLTHVLPLLPAGMDPASLISKNPRIPRAVGKLITGKGRLWGFPQDPSKLGKAERKTYEALTRSAEAIATTGAEEGLRQTVHLQHNKKGISRFDKRHEDTTFPDAYMLSCAGSDREVIWSHIAISGAYHKKNTIERAKEDHFFLIHFFSSIMFADPHQLGWDPTMKVLADPGQSTQYEIIVRSESGEEKTYRTLDSLSDSSTERLLGRGTRVWKAIRTQDGKDCGEPVALKDAWVDHDRGREGDVFTRLRQSSISAAHTVVLDKCFLTVQSHGDVFISDHQDCTWISPISQATPTVSHAPVVGPSGAIFADIPQDRRQVHYRVVFEEIGKPLSRETSLCTVFKIVADAAVALLAMHKCGWVHRDVSVGNILIFDDIAKIADLEYATNADYAGVLGQTGTDYFRAVEVDCSHYLFADVLRHRRAAKKSAGPPSPAALAAYLSGKLPPSAPRPPRRPLFPSKPFAYNPLHDLESLWWVAVYFVINKGIVHCDDEESEDFQSRSADQRTFARQLFYDQHTRHNVMVINSYFSTKLSCLDPSLLRIGEILEDTRSALVDAYCRVESMKELEKIDITIVEDVHSIIQDNFREACDILESSDIQVARFEDTKQGTKRKRPYTNDEVD